MRATGRELRELRRPLAVTKDITFSNLLCIAVRLQNDSSSLAKNTNVKGRTSFIRSNVSKNATSERISIISSSSRTMTSSENTGEVMVKNTSMTIA